MDRLAIPWDPGAAVCQLTSGPAATATICSTPLAARRWHTHICGEGLSKLRPHRHMAGALARLVRDAAGFCDLEAYIPELYRRATADAPEKLAIMDAVVSWPGCWERCLVDVSARSAHAARYTNTHIKPGVAAQSGEKLKADRYGDAVMPLVMETLGRLGADSADSLRRLLRYAATLGKVGPGAISKWRSTLERAVLFAVAENSLLAMGATSTARLGAVLNAQHAVAARPRAARSTNAPRAQAAAPPPVEDAAAPQGSASATAAAEDRLPPPPPASSDATSVHASSLPHFGSSAAVFSAFADTDLDRTQLAPTQPA